MEHANTGICILIADRHALLRHGLLGLLREARPGFHCADTDNAASLEVQLEATTAALVIVDLNLPGMDGVHGLEDLCRHHPEHRVIVLSDSEDRSVILACLAAGAQGYVLKTATPAQVLHAVDTVLNGGVFAQALLSGSMPLATTVAGHDMPPALSQLTDRQRAVFRLLEEGCATKTIARRLDLAVGTVKVHLAGIYRALGARTRLEALAIAHRAFV